MAKQHGESEALDEDAGPEWKDHEDDQKRTPPRRLARQVICDGKPRSSVNPVESALISNVFFSTSR